MVSKATRQLRNSRDFQVSFLFARVAKERFVDFLAFCRVSYPDAEKLLHFSSLIYTSARRAACVERCLARFSGRHSSRHALDARDSSHFLTAFSQPRFIRGLSLTISRTSACARFLMAYPPSPGMWTYACLTARCNVVRITPRPLPLTVVYLTR